MSNMEEIRYWVYTRRAPCLMKYDLDRKQQGESLPKPTCDGIIHSISDDSEQATPKKKPRQLSILDDESDYVKEENVFFETTNCKPQTAATSSVSDDDCDEDFTIKKSRSKAKKGKKNSFTNRQKKNDLVCSTPKPDNLRRSLRKCNRNINDTSQLNSSYEIFNGKSENDVKKSKVEHTKPETKCKQSLGRLSGIEKTTPHKKNIMLEKTKNNLKDEFENLSDLSGFTVSYIRSVKNTLKNGTSSKHKPYVNQTRNSDKPKVTVKVNKSVNPGLALNQSTDSSENCVNVVTHEVNSSQIDKSTSALKFVDVTSKSKRSDKTCDLNSTNDLAPRRYPQRRKNTTYKYDTGSDSPTKKPRKKGTPRKQRRKIKTGDSVLVLSNNEQSSSGVINVANHSTKEMLLKSETHSPSKKRRSCRSGKDSLREQSGFAACFSDSDDDKPLKPQKFFT